MWLQRYTEYLLRHRWQALALVFGVTFVPIIGILGILIAALVTLVKGIAEGALFTLAASLPFLLSFLFSTRGETVPLAVWAAVGVAVVSNVLTWAFAVMLRRKSTWGMILQVAALLGVLMVSVVHLAYPDITDWWGKQLQSYYSRAVSVAEMLDSQTTKTLAPSSAGTNATAAPTATNATKSGTKTAQPAGNTNANPSANGGGQTTASPISTEGTTEQNEGQLDAISVTKQYATGMMVAVTLFNAIMQLIVARWWQGLVFKPPTLRKELHSIRLSQLAGALFMLAMVFWYLGNRAVIDMMPVVYLLFSGAGLSLIHYLFGLIQSPTAWFWLVLLYVTLIFALPVSAFLLALVALLDVWFDLRKRIRKV